MLGSLLAALAVGATGTIAAQAPSRQARVAPTPGDDAVGASPTPTGTRLHGATGDDSTNDTAAIQAALDAGGTVTFPAGTYHVDQLYVSVAGTTLVGEDGARLTFDASGPGLYVTASDVTIRGLEIVGPQTEIWRSSESGVKAVGASATEPVRNLVVENSRIRRWSGGGVWTEFTTGLTVRNNAISDIGYAGVMLLSTTDGWINGNTIGNVRQSDGAKTSYGIAISRYTTADLSVYPRSARIQVHANTVTGVPLWECIDTHGGQQITITANVVTDCNKGIAVVPSKGVSGENTYAPLDVTVTANLVNSGRTDGSRGAGIEFVGAGARAGSPVELATGSVTGNTVRGHGTHLFRSAGILVYNTRALEVSKNSIINCAPTSVLLYHDNYEYKIVDNTISYAVSAGQTPIGYESTHNTGIVGGNKVTGL